MREKVSERGHKPGFYVVVSRDFIAGHDDVSTVMRAPVYGEVLGLRSEVVIGEDDGVPRQSAIRCDFLTLMFKQSLPASVADAVGAEAARLEGGAAPRAAAEPMTPILFSSTGESRSANRPTSSSSTRCPTRWQCASRTSDDRRQ